MAYADQEMSRGRLVAIILVILIHVAVGYALVTGLAYSAIKKAVERVTTVDVEEPPPPDVPPPPPPPDNVPPPPVAPPPPISISVSPPPIATVTAAPPAPPAPVLVAAPPAPPPPPPPPAPSKARGATPQGQGSWAARIQENYPARAIRDETEGRVGVRVTIGANGRVTACSVTGGSGSSVLDQAACEGMTRYARYNPALDDAGNPTSGQASTTIVYQLSR
ncbi:MAG: TonB family protein [Croceibacterium sp.]